jgi:hypothetical protein
LAYDDDDDDDDARSKKIIIIINPFSYRLGSLEYYDNIVLLS